MGINNRYGSQKVYRNQLTEINRGSEELKIHEICQFLNYDLGNNFYRGSEKREKS